MLGHVRTIKPRRIAADNEMVPATNHDTECNSTCCCDHVLAGWSYFRAAEQQACLREGEMSRVTVADEKSTSWNPYTSFDLSEELFKVCTVYGGSDQSGREGRYQAG